MIAVILLIYVIGIFLFLYLFHKWPDFFELSNYDEKDKIGYDDYTSNEEAYLSFAAFWPLYITLFSLVFVYRIFLKISIYFKKISKKEKNIS